MKDLHSPASARPHQHRTHREIFKLLARGIFDGMKDEPLAVEDDEPDWDFNDQETFQP